MRWCSRKYRGEYACAMQVKTKSVYTLA